MVYGLKAITKYYFLDKYQAGILQIKVGTFPDRLTQRSALYTETINYTFYF